MASLAKHMQSLDNSIFATLGETMLLPNSSDPIKGIFYNRYHEFTLSDNTVVGFEIAFHCQFVNELLELEENDEIEIFADDESLGIFFFRRRVPTHGDESGLTILELGR